MKKYFLMLLVLFSTFVISFSADAAEPQIILNGRNAPLKDKAYIINNRVYVPMRELFESIGAKVEWNNKTKSATATFNNTTLDFTINSNTVIKNGKKHWSDSQCKLINEKTYVPIRIILELLGFDVIWNETNHNVEIFTPSVTPDHQETEVPEFTNNNEFETKVLELINIERISHGLNKLILDDALSYVARDHSEDMYKRNFFDHTNPDGLSPFDRMKNYGISYRTAAENIAAGQSSPEDVVNAWMNSEGHRQNILNPNFNKIGIGYFYSGANYVHYWTQCFTN